MNKVVCFGEIMLRLNPEGYLRLTQAAKLEATYAGAESNTAVALANLGMESSFITKLPDNEVAKSAIRSLRAQGVDTRDIVTGGDRIGVLFLEKGASQRATKVIYDRRHSAIAEASAQDFDWGHIFRGASWFHFTGITPALGDNVARITEDACQAAHAMGLTVSCDINYRSTLWTAERASAVMSRLMRFVDVCIANEEHATKILGIQTKDTDVSDGQISHEGYRTMARGIMERFGCSKVALTLRGGLNASDNRWAGILAVGEQCFFSKEYLIHIVDRVGGGDAFAGGLIYALQSGYDPGKAVEFAVAAGCLKHTIEFDFNEVTLAEVLALMGGDGSGRVQR